MVLAWHLCLLAFYWHALASWQLSYILAFCHGLGYCTRPVVGQFPEPDGSVVYCCIKCAHLYVLSCSFTVRSVQGVLLSVAQF